MFAYGHALELGDAGVCVATEGAGPPRRVWVAFERASLAGLGGRLSFAVVLEEGADRVHLVYRTVEGAWASGERALVGLQDATGTAATVYERATFDALRSGLAMAFTPAP